MRKERKKRRNLVLTLEVLNRMTIPSSLPQHQVGLNHVPDCMFGSVSIMTLGSLPVVPIGSFNVVSSAGTVSVIQVGDCPFELFPFQYLQESA